MFSTISIAKNRKEYINQCIHNPIKNSYCAVLKLFKLRIDLQLGFGFDHQKYKLHLNFYSDIIFVQQPRSA